MERDLSLLQRGAHSVQCNETPLESSMYRCHGFITNESRIELDRSKNCAYVPKCRILQFFHSVEIVEGFALFRWRTEKSSKYSIAEWRRIRPHARGRTGGTFRGGFERSQIGCNDILRGGVCKRKEDSHFRAAGNAHRVGIGVGV